MNEFMRRIMSLAFVFAGSVERRLLARALPASDTAIGSNKDVVLCERMTLEAMRLESLPRKTSTFGHGGGHDFLVGEASLVTKNDRGHLHTSLIRQISGRMLDASYDKPNSVSPIPRLRFPRGPEAVIRAVVTIVISAVKGHPFWSVAHVFCEVPKRHPALANLNSSPAVIVERLIGRTKTPSSHVVPCAVQGVIHDPHFNFSIRHSHGSYPN